jgi:hypothetical protein
VICQWKCKLADDARNSCLRTDRIKSLHIVFGNGVKNSFYIHL